MSLVFYPEEIGAYLWATGNCGERELWRTGNCGGQGIVGTGNCGDRELDLQLPYNQYRKEEGLFGLLMSRLCPSERESGTLISPHSPTGCWEGGYISHGGKLSDHNSIQN